MIRKQYIKQTEYQTILKQYIKQTEYQTILKQYIKQTEYQTILKQYIKQTEYQTILKQYIKQTEYQTILKQYIKQTEYQAILMKPVTKYQYRLQLPLRAGDKWDGVGIVVADPSLLASLPPLTSHGPGKTSGRRATTTPHSHSRGATRGTYSTSHRLSLERLRHLLRTGRHRS